LQALIICPTEKAIIYIRSKRKRKNLIYYPRQTTLYIKALNFNSEGNVVFGKHKKWRLRNHFQRGSCISVSSPERDIIHIFVVHCDGAVEKVIFDRSTF
jgi:hypothetical protein